MIKISPEDLKLIAEYIHEISGIFLNESKAYLFETRFQRIMEEEGLTTFKELYVKTKRDPSKRLEKKMIDAISTNETLFFRDTGPFELLRHKILPELIDMKTSGGNGSSPPSIRIWSAASSTGQEIYSIAIVLKELLANLSKYKIYLLGTDISDAAISQASYGTYNKFEIDRGLPAEKLQKYFTSNSNSWKINDEIRSMAIFKKLNLMTNFNSLGKFDIIFCRNVAIYFKTEDKKHLFNRMADMLNPGGYFIIGSSESLTGICPRFEAKRHLKSIFYKVVQ